MQATGAEVKSWAVPVQTAWRRQFHRHNLHKLPKIRFAVSRCRPGSSSLARWRTSGFRCRIALSLEHPSQVSRNFQQSGTWGVRSECCIWTTMAPIAVAGDRQGRSNRVVRPPHRCQAGILRKRSVASSQGSRTLFKLRVHEARDRTESDVSAESKVGIKGFARGESFCGAASHAQTSAVMG